MERHGPIVDSNCAMLRQPLACDGFGFATTIRRAKGVVQVAVTAPDVDLNMVDIAIPIERVHDGVYETTICKTPFLMPRPSRGARRA